MSPPRRPHAGFTLVEMLVVIAIIGLLSAILIPAVYSAVISARRAAIAQEIAQMEMAIEKYKNDMGDYPPNFYENYDTHRNDGTWTQTILSRHLKRISRNAVSLPSDPGHPLAAQTSAGDYVLRNPGVSNAVHIDAAETLVFWLGGLSSNAMYPITGAGGPMLLDFANNSELAPPGVLHPSNRRATARFEFNEPQLRDVDNDGFYEYYPRYPNNGAAPYVYFDSRTYNTPTLNMWAEFRRSDVRGVARPYGYVSSATASYANPDTFQIICAGLDDDFGDGFSNPVGDSSNLPDHKVFPSGSVISGSAAYTRQDFDNMANFSDGQTLEDARPN